MNGTDSLETKILIQLMSLLQIERKKKRNKCLEHGSWSECFDKLLSFPVLINVGKGAACV